MTFPIEGPLTPEVERQLMLDLSLGNEEAVRVLYARFSRPIYSLGRRLLGTPESAEELTQDVFLAAWRKAPRFDPARGRLSTWLMTIAHNLAVDRLRHDRGASQPPLVLVDELPEARDVIHEDEAALDRETARRALATLSPAERKLLSLAYFHGMTAREIALADGIPLGTVKTRLRTALIRLRRSQMKEE